MQDVGLGIIDRGEPADAPRFPDLNPLFYARPRRPRCDCGSKARKACGSVMHQKELAPSRKPPEFSRKL
jgi:hypothetical protein